MRTCREVRHRRKKNKAQRSLEKLMNHYSHNDLIMHLQIGSYLRMYCKDRDGVVTPDAYIQGYTDRFEKKMREEAE